MEYWGVSSLVTLGSDVPHNPTLCSPPPHANTSIFAGKDKATTMYVCSSAASQFESCTVAELTHVTTVEIEISTCLIIMVLLFERIHRSMLVSIELYILQ